MSYWRGCGVAFGIFRSSLGQPNAQIRLGIFVVIFLPSKEQLCEYGVSWSRFWKVLAFPNPCEESEGILWLYRIGKQCINYLGWMDNNNCLNEWMNQSINPESRVLVPALPFPPTNHESRASLTSLRYTFLLYKWKADQISEKCPAPWTFYDPIPRKSEIPFIWGFPESKGVSDLIKPETTGCIYGSCQGVYLVGLIL